VSRLDKLRQLSLPEMRILAEAWLTLLWADLSLRFFPLPRVQRILAASPPRTGSPERPLSSERMAYLVDVAVRYQIRPVRCLQRALVLQRLLAKQGLETELKIGVQKRDGVLFAHAWLESAGLPCAENEEACSRFHPLLGARIG
jgi:hypothetical protein